MKICLVVFFVILQNCFAMEKSIELLIEAVSKFIELNDGASFDPTLGGVNNVVKLVHIPERDDLIIRIYNNGEDRRKVLFEHAVLDPKCINFPYWTNSCSFV